MKSVWLFTSWELVDDCEFVLEEKIPPGEVVFGLGIVVVGVFVEVAQVGVVFDGGHVGRVERVVAQTLPAEALEPLVFLNVFDAAALIAQTVDGVLATQPFDESGRYFGNFAWKVDRVYAFEYDVVRVHRVCARERRIS